LLVFLHAAEQRLREIIDEQSRGRR
jgi:hypothetical protein